jgi:acetyl-CoA C-acetyltransferase
MPSTVILGTARTPFGKMGGGLSSLDATELGGKVIESALDRAGVEPGQVDQVVFGQVLQAGQGQIPSRQAQIKAASPRRSPRRRSTRSAPRACARSASPTGDPRRRRPRSPVTGGMESMSQAPYLLPGARFGFRMGDVSADRRDDPRRPHQPLHRASR